MADEERVHIALMRVQRCWDILTENLRRADRDHPGDMEIVESGLFQSTYTTGHLDLELRYLYELFGTSEAQLQHDYAESDEDLHSPPGAHMPWVELSEIKPVND